jgi:predicted nucleotidyltransferase
MKTASFKTKRKAGETPALERYPDALRGVVRQVVTTVHPLKVILFGSRARGDARDDSDYDLMIIVRNGVHRLHTALGIQRSIIKNGLVCNFLVSTSGDFKKYGGHPSLIYKNILEEGVVLYAA